MYHLKKFESYNDGLEEFSDEFLSQFEIEKEGNKYFVKFHNYFNQFKSLESLKFYIRSKYYVYYGDNIAEFKKLINHRTANLFLDDNWLIKKLISYNKFKEVHLLLNAKNIYRYGFASKPSEKSYLLSLCNTDKMRELISERLK